MVILFPEKYIVISPSPQFPSKVDPRSHHDAPVIYIEVLTGNAFKASRVFTR